MRILGIDPGSIVTGFGIVDHIKGVLSLVDQGQVRTPKGADLSLRLKLIHEGLTDVILRTRPTVAAVETPFAGLNPKSLIQLAHARGVALLAIRDGGMELFEYSPRSVKSAIVGYGAAEKQQVDKMVRILLPASALLEMSPDATDALAIAICHAHSYRMSEKSLLRK